MGRTTTRLSILPGVLSIGDEPPINRASFLLALDTRRVTLDSPMPSSQFVICEGSNRWAVAMRWVLAGSKIQIQEAESWEACCSALESATARVVGLELRHDNIEQVVDWLLIMRARFPTARAVILLGSHELRGAFAMLFEAGAVHVAASTRNLDSTARLVIRLIRASARSHTDYEQSVRDRIPW